MKTKTAVVCCLVLLAAGAALYVARRTRQTTTNELLERYSKQGVILKEPSFVGQCQVISELMSPVGLPLHGKVTSPSGLESDEFRYPAVQGCYLKVVVVTNEKGKYSHLAILCDSRDGSGNQKRTEPGVESAPCDTGREK